jgi:hypothetical protein
MTGEMHVSEVTPESYPFHFALAAEFNGEVRPFDQYQGPYVFISGLGRVWLSDDGVFGRWYREETGQASTEFLIIDGRDLYLATSMSCAREILP